jgi:hypothetical protein
MEQVPQARLILLDGSRRPLGRVSSRNESLDRECATMFNFEG